MNSLMKYPEYQIPNRKIVFFPTQRRDILVTIATKRTRWPPLFMSKIKSGAHRYPLCQIWRKYMEQKFLDRRPLLPPLLPAPPPPKKRNEILIWKSMRLRSYTAIVITHYFMTACWRLVSLAVAVWYLWEANPFSSPGFFRQEKEKCMEMRMQQIQGHIGWCRLQGFWILSDDHWILQCPVPFSK